LVQVFLVIGQHNGFAANSEQRHEITENAGQEKSTSQSNPPKPINISLGTQWNHLGSLFPHASPHGFTQELLHGQSAWQFSGDLYGISAAEGRGHSGTQLAVLGHHGLQEETGALVALLDVNGWGDFMRFLCGSCVMC